MPRFSVCHVHTGIIIAVPGWSIGHEFTPQVFLLPQHVMSILLSHTDRWSDVSHESIRSTVVR